MIASALEDNFAPFNELLDVLSRPFDEQPENARYLAPPAPDEVVRNTFCGT